MASNCAYHSPQTVFSRDTTGYSTWGKRFWTQNTSTLQRHHHQQSVSML